jgi:isoleucyl-tRNA synthetase
LSIITDELNVKEAIPINSGKKVVVDTTITESLQLEGLMRDIVRQIQEARKKAGLNVSDRINVGLSSSDQLINRAIDKHKKTIDNETLILPGEVTKALYQDVVSIGDQELTIAIQKAK